MTSPGLAFGRGIHVSREGADRHHSASRNRQNVCHGTVGVRDLRAMADTLTEADRSRVMSRIHARNTGLERRVRAALTRLGLRYRLHVKALPGTPDIVMRKRRLVIEVRGCFWHSHASCRIAKIPSTNHAYWVPKLKATKQRDAKNLRALQQDGWRVLILWQCQLAKMTDENLIDQLVTFCDLDRTARETSHRRSESGGLDRPQSRPQSPTQSP